MRISSSIPLPELPVSGPMKEKEHPDVFIESASPDKLWEELELGGSNFLYKDGRFLFLIPETAIYCIEDAYRITVAPLTGADPEKVRVYLLGTCMGALLMIRNVLPLHGSAIMIGGKAYAFLGDSGAGKSTLAATLVSKGYELISDDVIPVSFAGEGGRLVVMPSYPQQKLWQESIDQLGLASGHYQSVYRETTKFAVPVLSRFCNEPVPLAGLFELVKSESEPAVSIRRLSNLDRLRIVLMHTYRNMLIPRLGLEQWHFKIASGVADQVNVHQLIRPTNGFTAQDLAAEIIRTIDKGGV
ncbi:aldolase [Paenibacillus lignilyticus]|uniref:Aldolase n=1 Tax=Paenibacillus lignilyticus TaxID=1172615 RepID=A0ABS5CC71_9BACL|nr:aldolase [Paenibacillus lignilyticus]MBP3961801.1 aldolase [Paenibacillus lignilyticus]MBP3963528.1 aldolase [Paenibacillus lignilyticus]